MQPDEFQVGEWRVRPSLNRIERGEEIVRLEPKVIALLVELARRQGDLLTKDDIFASVWQGVIVSEDVIAQAISKLRAALGEERDERRYIETVWKKGYRLLAPVSGLTGGPAAARHATSAAFDRRLKFLLIAAAALLIAILFIWRAPNGSAEFAVESVSRVTQQEGVEGYPTLSADGAAYVYASQTDSSAPRRLWLQTLGGGQEATELEISGRIFSPVLSPDGERLAVMNRKADGCRVEVFAIAAAETEDAGSCDGNIYADLAWSSDGRQFAFSGRAPGERFNRIWVMDAATGQRHAVTSPSPGDWGDFDPAFTADGGAIVFVRAFSEAMHDLFEVDLVGGGERRISRDYQSFYSPLPTHDGSHVLVAGSRGGPAGLWDYSITGGPARLVYQGPNALRNLAASRGFDVLLAEEIFSRTGIWRGDLNGDGANLRPLIRPTGWSMHARPSPDGSKIAFVSNRAGRYQLWLADADGGNPEALTDFDASFLAMPAFSPDGGRLLFDARVDGNADIYLLDLGGRGIENLTAAGSADMAASWSADGTGIYFGSDRTGSWQVHRLDLASRQVAQVTRGGGYYAREAVDGSIYYARYREPGLWHAEGGREVLVNAEYPARGDWPNWDLAGRFAYVLIREGRPAALARLTLASGEIEELIRLPYVIPRWDLALSIDAANGDFLLAQQDISEGDLLMFDLKHK